VIAGTERRYWVKEKIVILKRGLRVWCIGNTTLCKKGISRENTYARRMKQRRVKSPKRNKRDQYEAGKVKEIFTPGLQNAIVLWGDGQRVR